MIDLIFIFIAAFATFGFVLRAGTLNVESRMMAYLLSLFCLWAFVTLHPAGILLENTVPPAGWGLIFLAAFYLAVCWLTDLFHLLRKWAESRKALMLPPYLDEVTKAMMHMKQRKVGALIILEGKQPLAPFLRSSIPFDSEVKSEVVISLFTPPSMVHDGAMIIRQGRIVKLKAVLPIGGQRSFPMGVGTRHRSACSIAEVSDAVALVVSEERGEMSVMAGGCWEKAESREDLRRLMDLAVRNKKPFYVRRGAQVKTPAE